MENLLPLGTVAAKLGYSRNHFAELRRRDLEEGTIGLRTPRSLQLSARRIVFAEDDIEAWLASRYATPSARQADTPLAVLPRALMPLWHEDPNCKLCRRTLTWGAERSTSLRVDNDRLVCSACAVVKRGGNIDERVVAYGNMLFHGVRRTAGPQWLTSALDAVLAGNVARLMGGALARVNVDALPY